MKTKQKKKWKKRKHLLNQNMKEKNHLEFSCMRTKDKTILI